MVKQTLRKWMLALIAGAVVLVFLAVPQAFSQNRGAAETGSHNQRGMEYFKLGFYDYAPKGQTAEADRNYGLAVQEFKAEISRDPLYLEAHRNLARVYYVRRNFEEAAEEYKRVTELSPSDLDAYVNQSLALVELKRLNDAIQALENAKRATADQKALDTLDKYIAKIRVHQEKEVR